MAYISAKQRQELAKEGKALPDGSFPIRNASDLKNAVKAFGRASNPEETKKFICKRAKELNAESELPEDWLEKAKKGTPGYEEWLRNYRAKRNGGQLELFPKESQEAEKKLKGNKTEQELLDNPPVFVKDEKLWRHAVHKITYGGTKSTSYGAAVKLYQLKLKKKQAEEGAN